MTLPRITVLTLIAAALLAGCGNRDGDVTLTKLRPTGEGPDEFSIIPGKPLQPPRDSGALPTPTPGAGNRTDPTPRANGIAALGGNAGAVRTGGVPGRDGALVNHAARYGTTPSIRRTLAREDREVRRRHGRVNVLGIFPQDDYTAAYKRQWLDPGAERDRLRARGVTTPSAPPAED